MLSSEHDSDQFRTYLEMCIGEILQKWRSIMQEMDQGTSIIEVFFKFTFIHVGADLLYSVRTKA